jgi:hypothetical protein
MTNIAIINNGASETIWGCGDKPNLFLVMRAIITSDLVSSGTFSTGPLNLQCRGIG